MISVEAAMNAPGLPLPQWKIDFVREAKRILEEEKGRNVTAKEIKRRVPSLSIEDIEVAMTLLKAQRRRERRSER
jgi:hypothetical protein